MLLGDREWATEFTRALSQLGNDPFNVKFSAEQSPDERPIGLRMSSMGNCARQLYYRLAYPVASQYTSSWQTVMGYAGQDVIANVLRRMGYTLSDEESEVFFVVPGHVDGILTGHDLGPLKAVWDSKLRNSFAYKDLVVKGLPKGEPGMYCLAPSTKVLRSDLTWDSLDRCSIGDTLIGFDENAIVNKYRRILPSLITGKRRTIRPTWSITLADGRQIITSYDHRFWGRSPSGGNSAWKQIGKMGRFGSYVGGWSTPWDSSPNCDLSWLSGLIDGEGYFGKSGGSWGVTISQKEGLVLSKAESILNQFNFKYNRQPTKTSTVINLRISGGISEHMRLLGLTKPVRMMPKWEQGLKEGRFSLWPKWTQVIGMEYLGNQELIDIETSSSTFLTEGLMSHNCQLQGYMAATKADLAVITVMPFDLTDARSRLKQSKVDYEAGVLRIVLKPDIKAQELITDRASMIEMAIRLKLIPTREADPLKDRFPCGFCEYQERCMRDGQTEEFTVSPIPEDWK